MKRDNRSGRLVRNIILVALLAVLCIGGVELAACRHFAPETYDRIVAPVRYAATVVADTGKAALNAAGQFCNSVAVKTVELATQAAQHVSNLAAQTADALDELINGPEVVILQVVTPPPEDSQPPVTDPPSTQVMEVNGQQVLTGGVAPVTYFCQSDEEWADQPYGTDPIGPYGCGPTAMAMAIASLTDTDTDPAKMAAWAVEHGYWARRSGSYHSIVRGTARAFGLEVEALPSRTADEVRRVLREGKLLVALVGPGHFTDGGHFILLRGVTLSGDVLVADPNSLERSLELWDPQIVLDELSSARDNGAPLWVLSAPAT